jgi:uncharacterized protein (TIGR02145 family)
MTRKAILLILMVVMSQLFIYSQSGIGTLNLHPSAQFDVTSTNRGFLPPRLTNEQRDSIVSPADGLMIFNTSSGCPNYYNSGKWYQMCGSVILPVGTINTLDCGLATNNGILAERTITNGLITSIPYTGGNGGTYNSQIVNSTGVTGLTAALTAGIFSEGDGLLTYAISGNPSSDGIANFALNIGDQMCTLSITVEELLTQYPASFVFCEAGPTAIVDVINPITGRTWMDRNLGAAQAATSSTDAASYGDLYQWGRVSDGHQCRNSSTTSILSSMDQPGHGDFIIVSQIITDWRSSQNDDLWQGLNGINNPCPRGYRLPTEAELETERSSWNSNEATGAYSSPLKWSTAGVRNSSNGSLVDDGFSGFYWSSSVSSNFAKYLIFNSSDSFSFPTNRSDGLSVRCIMN